MKGEFSMYIGSDYYPEHWPRERWREDARLMQAAGLNLVRMAEFAWDRMEPEEGSFDFSWLDEAIQILAEHGIKTVLGTPTATPPAWLMHKHPEIYLVNREGRRASFGSRRHYCPTIEVYHSYTRKIVRKLAEHYASNENVIGYQVDNEFGGSRTRGRCYCNSCHRAFQQWLEAKYRTLSRLNESWGTAFWSQTYSAWEQIPLPWPNEAPANPSLELDYYRFISDAWIKYQNLQVEILRNVSPGKFVTHNLMGLFPSIDYRKLGEPLDFVAWDNYPRFSQHLDPAAVAMAHDLTRSLKNRPFWVMEQQSGPAGQNVMGTAPSPGELRLWTLQSIAHGADSIVYFRWRTCRWGAEQYWHGILPHDGKPGHRYAEIKRAAQDMAKLKHLMCSAYPAQVAVMRSYDVLWAFEAQPTSADLDYDQELKSYYRALHSLNVNIDVITPEAEYDKYKVIVAPSLYLTNDDIVQRLEKFVAAGGTLLLSFRSGVKDWENVVHEETLPAHLAGLVGASIADYTSTGRFESPNAPAQLAEVEFVHPELTSYRGTASVWCDILNLESAEALARYHGNFFNGTPAITLNKHGNGSVIYVGTSLNDVAIRELSKWILRTQGLQAPLGTPTGVEIIERRYNEKPVLFVLNHNSERATVSIPTAARDILTDQRYNDELLLDPFDVAVLELV